MTQALCPPSAPPAPSTPPPPPAPAREAPVRRRKSRLRKPFLIGGVVATLAVLAYMLSAYAPPSMATSRIDVHGDPVHFLLLIGHIGFATVATLTGLAQFWPWLRRTRPRLHRWTGRVYFFGGVFPSVVLALPVALMSGQGFSNMAALLAGVLLWGFTGWQGWRAARQRRFAEHRNWMIRNYALTLGSLASRPWQFLLAPVIFSYGDSTLYHGDQLAMIHDLASASAWLGFFVNLVVAEIYIQRKYGKRAAAARTAI